MNDTGGAAFPTAPEQVWDDEVRAFIHLPGKLGMSLRDYFAGKALAGTMAGWSSYRDEFAPKTAASCYALADAMLAERAKVTP